MLSYQHIYHAAGWFDVHKHAALCLMWQSLMEEGGSAPLTYIDTHAGRGVYDLTAAEALKIKAADSGLARINPEHLPKNFAPYVRALKRWAPAYPGSAGCIAALKRKQDQMHLFELHPREIQFLSTSLGKIPSVAIKAKDGYGGVFDILAQGVKGRTLILIDPSYEIKTEYQTVADIAAKILSLMPQATLLIWYPVLATGNKHEELLLSLENTKQKFVLSVIKAPGTPDKGMIQSGLVFCNTPAGFDIKIKVMTDLLGRIFS